MKPGRLFLLIALSSNLVLVSDTHSSGRNSRTGTLSGIVTDKQSGDPLPLVDLFVGESRQSAISNQDGSYQLLDLVPGSYTIYLERIGFTPATITNVVIGGGMITTLDAELNQIAWTKRELRRKGREARKIPEGRKGEVANAANSANTFAWDLLSELSDHEGNLIFSPYSVSAVLAMIYVGASGNTKSEMQSVLHFPGDDNALHAGWTRILGSLKQGAESGVYKLDVANSLWGQEGYPFLQSFLTILNDQYETPLELVDFAGAPEQARKRINTWVADRTTNRIKNLIPPSGINSLTNLVLVNAIYFKGFWKYPFKESKTRNDEFLLTDGNSVPVRMMVQAGHFQYAKLKKHGLQILELPYDSGQISMIVLLPRKTDGLASLEMALDAKRLEGWLNKMEGTRVEINFPRIKFTTRILLKEILAQMGMSSAFSKASDFSAMDGTKLLFISEVFHEGFAEINEQGTEATAATAGDMRLRGMGHAPPPPVFRADHPFLFLIRDNVTGVILFIGRVADPTQN